LGGKEGRRTEEADEEEEKNATFYSSCTNKTAIMYTLVQQ